MRNNKKILMLLSNAFDPDPRVYQEAKSLVKNGYFVKIICWDREYKKSPRETIDGIEVERIYVRSTHGRGISQMFFLFLFWLKAFFRIINTDFDIIHAHDFDTLPLGFIIAKLRRKPIVYDAHESFADMLSDSLPKWLLRIMVATENFLIERVDLLITVGSVLEKEFQNRGAKRTCVVGNWKKLEDFDIPNEKREKLKKELGILNEKLILCFIGWFNKERKLSELLDAVSQSKEAHLLIGGDGPDRNLVERVAKENSNITYLGYVAPEKIPLYTSISDAIVYSFDSKNPNARFSAPNKLFEALASGKAVISGNFGEIGRVIREEGCGVSLEPINKNKLLEAFNLLSDSSILEKYHINAYKACQKKYNWEKAEEILKENYKKLCVA